MLELLESRAVPASLAVVGFGGNAQHTSVYQPAAQTLDVIKWHTPVDLDPQYSGTDLLIHYGAPLVTDANTVLVPVKTGATDGFEINAFNGNTGSAMYTLPTDYTLPSHNWTPSYSPGLVVTASGTRLYYAGAGGTIDYIDNPDSSTPSSPVQEVFYTSLANYQANASAFNASVYVDTPITSDSNGDIFFGFRVQGTAPAPLNTSQSGYARIDPNGNATYVLAGNASGDSSAVWDNHNAAPALSNDGSTLYVVVKSAASWSTHGDLLALDSTTLATKDTVFLTDPVSHSGAGVLDDSTASPMVGPDGDVYLGVMGNPYNGSRGYMLHFNSSLSQEYAPGGFGWDDTAAVVPASMVPSYTGTSSYLIFTKYNNYADASPGAGDGVNQAAVLDPHAVETDPRNDGDPNLQIMREVLTVNGPTVDHVNRNSSNPNAVREWCINTAAVDPALDAVFFPSEDGNLYRWCLKDDQLMQAINLAAGIGQAYVPTVLGPSGTVYTISNATLLAVGQQAGDRITIKSSNEDVRGTVAGDSVTFTATVTNTSSSGGIPTGTMTFEDTTDGSTTVLASVSLDANGQAAYTTSGLPAGGRFITAVYSGDPSFTAGQATLVQFVHQSATTTALTASPNPADFGQPVTLTATVTPVTSGLAIPTGLVTFMEGPTFLGQTPLNGSGQATFVIAGLAAGTHTITAIYQSDPVYATSRGDDSASPLVVYLDTTNTALTGPSTAPVVGQTFTLQAIVTVVAPGTGTPTGSVTFYDGSTAVGTAPMSGASASLSVSTSSAGSHSFTAVYSGDANDAGSTSPATPITVKADSTKTTLTFSPAQVVVGQSVNLTATVSVLAPGSGTPTGSVTFQEGSTVLGTATLSGATAALPWVFTPSATHKITAVYSGDPNDKTSTVASNLFVAKDATTTALVSSANPAVLGQSVTFTATVSVVPPDFGTATGNVVFKDGSTVLATIPVDSHGVATYTISTLAQGIHTIAAAYQGDANDRTSTGSVSERIQSATTVSLSSSDLSARQGSPVTFTATVMDVAPGTGTPSGTVEFFDGTTLIGTATIVNGIAKFTISTLALGSHNISAVYPGNTSHQGSTSQTIVQTIN
jgi:hypothetical protein